MRLFSVFPESTSETKEGHGGTEEGCGIGQGADGAQVVPGEGAQPGGAEEEGAPPGEEPREVRRRPGGAKD